jgi:hypothetical protein
MNQQLSVVNHEAMRLKKVKEADKQRQEQLSPLK